MCWLDTWEVDLFCFHICSILGDIKFRYRRGGFGGSQLAVAKGPANELVEGDFRLFKSEYK